MEPEITIAKAFTKGVNEFGLAVVLVAVIVIVMYMVIKHILKQSDTILQMAMSQNQSWISSLNAHTNTVKEFHNHIIDSSKYQRFEHEKMIKQLEDISEKNVKVNNSMIDILFSSDKWNDNLNKINDGIETSSKEIKKLNELVIDSSNEVKNLKKSIDNAKGA